MSEFIPIFDIFEQYRDKAPQNISEMSDFIEKCQEKGYLELADYLLDWEATMHYYMEKEFEDLVPKTKLQVHGIELGKTTCYCGEEFCSYA